MQLALSFLMATAPHLGQIQQADPEAMNWVRQMLREDSQLEKVKEPSSKQKIQFSETTKCSTISSSIPDETMPIYVLISFSVPEEAWVDLSKELEEKGGAFVLRGLPHNSFKELSKKIQRLNLLGVSAPIQINPKLFSTYQVSHVPTFLIQNGEEYDKIRGNVSLKAALGKVKRETSCAL